MRKIRNLSSSNLYVAYASDVNGTGFSLTASDSLPYRAEFSTTEDIENPTLQDFVDAGAVFVRYIGLNGTVPVGPVAEGSSNAAESGAVFTENANIKVLSGIIPEVESFINRTKQAGGDLTLKQITAVNEFVLNGKKNGWWDLQKDMCLFLPTNGGINAAIVKLKDTANKQIINNGYLNSDLYEKGIFPGAPNNSKFLNLNVRRSELGISLSDMSLTIFTPEDFLDWRYVTTGSGHGYSFGGVISDYVNDTTNKLVCFGFNGSNAIGAFNEIKQIGGVETINSLSGIGSSMTNSVVYTRPVASVGVETSDGYFVTNKTVNGSTVFWGNTSLSFYSIGLGMAEPIMKKFQIDLLKLMMSLGRIVRKQVNIISGDSIGAGAHSTRQAASWAHIISRTMNRENINVSRGERKLTENTSLVYSGYEIRNDLLLLNQLFDSTFFLALGTNDLRSESGNSNDYGNPTILNDIFNKGAAICGQIMWAGSPIVILSNALNTENATTLSLNKQLDYVKKLAELSKWCRDQESTSKVYFINLYHLFLDTPTGMLSDGVHFTNAGHKAAANEIIRVMKDVSQIRKVTLNYSNIAAGSSESMTVMVLNAVSGNPVFTSANQSLPIGMSISSYVSADNTVTVTLSNLSVTQITAGTINLTIEVKTGY